MSLGAPLRYRVVTSAVAAAWDKRTNCVSEQTPHHIPVLEQEVLEHLALAPGLTLLDGTVGLGGHAVAALPHLAPGGRLIGLDWDMDMVAHARHALAAASRDGDSVEVVCEQANYSEFPDVLKRHGIECVDRMLLDLGVNSAQLSDPARGFAFDHDGPLDMRFNPDWGEPALDLINRLPEAELADLFYNFGQESGSRRIAKKICQVRHHGRITTTQALAAAVSNALNAGGGKTHPATRVFQALRIAVNRELDNLDRFLEQIPSWLAPNGRVALISFHSLEDGAVKRFFKAQKAAGVLRELTKRPITPTPRELKRNARARSAKLRIAERLPGSEMDGPADELADGSTDADVSTE